MAFVDHACRGTLILQSDVLWLPPGSIPFDPTSCSRWLRLLGIH